MPAKSKIAFPLFFIVLMQFSILHAQFVPSHVSHKQIYEFLDELSDLQVIDINTNIKPYSRTFILEQLLTADLKTEFLSKRQKDELAFYLRDYRKDEIDENSSKNTSWAWINKPEDYRIDFFHYQDSSFNLTVNPILGGILWSNQNGTFHHWWNGIETHASYKNFSLYASLRDNHESNIITGRDFMNQRIGAGNIKYLSGGKIDYEEMRAGITYSWKWGHAGLIMDQFTWGDAVNGSNIFSGRSPSFARLDLQLNPADWLQFNYIHGMLVSEVVDSTLSFWATNSYGTDYREVYHPKYLAANLFTLRPFPRFYIGIGNSVVYDHRTPKAAFLIPVMFWKAVDHSLNAGIDNMNSNLFLTISSRNLKGVHIYSSAFIDEIQVGRIFRENEYNFTSWKIGASVTPIPLATIRAEYTWSNALVFMHYVPTTTFESNQYNLGHFLEDNARDIYFSLQIKPWYTLAITAYYNLSQKGPDHTALGTNPRYAIEPLTPIVWERQVVGIQAQMQIINDLYLRLGYRRSNVTGEQEFLDRWTPSVYHGLTGTLNVGLNYGF